MLYVTMSIDCAIVCFMCGINKLLSFFLSVSVRQSLTLAIECLKDAPIPSPSTKCAIPRIFTHFRLLSCVQRVIAGMKEKLVPSEPSISS